MKKGYLFFVCLAVLSLACMQNAAQAGTIEEDTSARFSTPAEIESGAVYVMPDDIETRAPKMCAEVIADRSLHLRKGPSADDIVLTWLDRGDVVEVISERDLDWTRVRFEGFEGYARSVYLKKKECE